MSALRHEVTDRYSIESNIQLKTSGIQGDIYNIIIKIFEKILRFMKHLLPIFFLLLPFFGYSQTVQIVESMGFERSISPLIKVKKEKKDFFYHLAGNHWIDDVEEHAADLFVVIKDGYYGVLNEDGDLIVPIAYDEIELATAYDGQWHKGKQYDYKYLVLKKNGKTGVADENGKIIVPVQFQKAEVINKNIIGVADDHLWGWVSALNGQILQRPQYEYITSFLSDEFVEIRTHDKSGLAKINGELIVPVEYDSHLQYIKGDGQTYIKGKKGTQLDLMDTNGNVLLSGYTDYKIIDGSKWLIFKQGNHYGVVDPISKKVIIKNEFEQLDSFIRNLGIAKKASGYGVIDINNKTILPFDYEEIRVLAAHGNHKYSSSPVIGMSDLIFDANITEQVKQRLTYEVQIEQAPYFFEVTKNGKTGICNWDGKTIIPLGKYQNIKLHYYNGKTFFLVGSNQNSGIVDENGMEILPVHYSFDDGYQYSASGIENQFDISQRFITFSDGKAGEHHALKIGLFDLQTKKVLISPHEQQITLFNKDLILVRKLVSNYHYQFSIYHIGQDKICTFDNTVTDIRLVNDHFLLVEHHDKSLQLTDTDGKLVYSNTNWTSDGSYDLIRFPNYEKYPSGRFYHGLKKIYAKEGNLFIDTMGNEKCFEEYDQVDDFYEGYAIAAKKIIDKKNYSGFKYQRGMIDLKGNIVVPFEYEQVLTTGKESDILIFSKLNKQIMVRRDGQIILGPGYQDLEVGGAYLNFTFAKGDKYGLADWSGKILVEPLYDEIRRNYEGEDKTWPLLVKEGEWYYFVGRDGQKYAIKSKEKRY